MSVPMERFRWVIFHFNVASNLFKYMLHKQMGLMNITFNIYSEGMEEISAYKLYFKLSSSGKQIPTVLLEAWSQTRKP